MRRVVVGVALVALAALPARAQADGEPDPAFAGGGPAAVQLSTAPDAAITRLSEIAARPGGGYVVAGDARLASGAYPLRVAALGADGSPAAGFTPFASSGWDADQYPNPRPRGLWIGADGTIGAGVARKVDTDGDPATTEGDLAALRLGPAGALDQGYGSGGLAAQAAGPQVATTDAAAGPDGTTFVAGIGSGVALIAKVDRFGLPVGGFGTGGVVTTTFGLSSASATALTVDAAGGVLVGGFGQAPGGARLNVVARLAPGTGALDPSFGSGGVARLPALSERAGGEVAPVVGLQAGPAGIAVAASVHETSGREEVAIARLTSAGTPVAGFGSGGVRRLQLTSGSGLDAFSRVSAVALQVDGRVVFTGEDAVDTFHSDALVVRLAADGSLDPSFGAGGIVRDRQIPATQPVGETKAEALVIAGDRIGVAGTVGSSGYVRSLIAPQSAVPGVSAPGAGAGPAAGAVLGASAGGGSAGAGGRVALGSARSFRLDRRGRIGIALSCPATSSGCSGGAGLVASTGRLPARAAARRKVARAFGKASYRLAAGARRTIRIRMSRPARRAVSRGGRLRARLVIRRAGARIVVVKVVIRPRRR